MTVLSVFSLGGGKSIVLLSLVAKKSNIMTRIYIFCLFTTLEIDDDINNISITNEFLKYRFVQNSTVIDLLAMLVSVFPKNVVTQNHATSKCFLQVILSYFAASLTKSRGNLIKYFYNHLFSLILDCPKYRCQDHP